MGDLRQLGGVLAACLLLAAPATAQQFEILHGFQAPLANAKAPLLAASDGALYGVLATGGQGGVGAIFVTRPQANGSVITTYLHAFDRSEGGGVVDGLVEGHDSWLYGVAPEHGAHGRGSVFKFNRVTGQLVVLHAFSGPDGATPRGPIVVADDGNYYGTATAGGPDDHGTIFKLTPEGVLTTFHAFGSADISPPGLLLQAGDSHLYGISAGAVFRLTLAGTRTLLHTFFPDDPFTFTFTYHGLVEAADGHLYGIVRGGFPLAGPAVFYRLTLDGVFTEIHSRPGIGFDRTYLYVAPDGSLLGTFTGEGGPNGSGSLFRLSATGTFTVLHDYTAAEGVPYSGIVRHPNGLFYGTTVGGGATGHGTIYSVGAGGAIDIRHSFRPIFPYAPSGPPIDGPDGAMYGTTVAGGLFNQGTVYRLSASGITVIHHFFGLNGAHPVAKLLLGPDGLLYGTTYDGGIQNRGTIYRISPAGAFQTLHGFTTTEGRHPTAGLIRAADGNYWGTTLEGGSGDTGTAFKISAAGAFTQMNSFVSEVFNPNAMAFPVGGLVQAQDGNFYGGTYASAGSFGGSVFQLTPSGVLTRLRVFTGAAFFGPAPQVYAPLIAGSDGALYGGACCGGVLGGGPDPGDPPQVFRLTVGGGLTTVRAMEGVYSGITEGSDQAFYGVANTENATATLFSLDRDGTLSMLKTLSETEGVFSSGVRTAGDWIIGSAYAGGPAGGGVIFRFRRD